MKIAEMSVSSLSLALDNFIDHKIHESLVAEKQSSLQFVMNKDHTSCGTVYVVRYRSVIFYLRNRSKCM